jgi:5-methylthioadenosine/S-adenosylhomocysteine deaminase
MTMVSRPNDRPARILIHGGVVLTMDPSVGDLPAAEVLVEDGVIAAVGTDLGVEDAYRIDAAGMIVTPGLIDTHRHTWQSTLHGIGPDWIEAEYFAAMRNRFGPHYRTEDLYVSNLLGAIESINSGVTTMLDWSHLMNTPEHADAAVQAWKDSGMRAVFAYGNSNEGFQLPNDIRVDAKDAERVRDEHFSSQGLVSMAMALRGPDYSSMDVTRDDFDAARRLGLPITVHVGSNGTYGRSVAQLSEAGLLGPDITHVHCNTTMDDELDMIAESGGTISISAEAEAHLGCGLIPVDRAVARGVRPSVSTDVPSVIAMDMFGALRTMIALQRGMVGQARIDGDEAGVPAIRLTTTDYLDFATVQGANTLGLADRVGRIAPGLRADLALISHREIGTFPICNPSAAVVLSATPASVDTVIIDGHIRKRGGQLVGIDVDRLRQRAESSRDHLLAAAGVEQAF